MGSGLTDMTVAALMSAFLYWADRHYRKNAKGTTEASNLELALRPVAKLYGHTRARDFGPLALQAVRRAMIDDGLCRGEINRRVRRIVRMFKWAVGQELIPDAIHHRLTAVQGIGKGRDGVRESAPVKPVHDSLVVAVRPFVAPQVWAMIELQRLTGMRPGEVVAMRTGDLDTGGRVWTYTPERHRTEGHGKPRTIYLGPRAQEVVEPWLRTDLAAYLFSPQEWVEARNAQRRADRKTPMTPSQRKRRPKPRPEKAPGERYTTSSYAHAVAAACRRAFPHPHLASLAGQRLTREQRRELAAWKVEHREELRAWQREHRWHPNQLRHNAATYLRREFGLDVARIILGHSSPVVPEIYAEIDKKAVIKVMEQVG